MAQRSAWYVPAESNPIESVWIAFPRANALNVEALWQLSALRRAVARITEAMAKTTPIVLLVDPQDTRVVDSYVDTHIPRFVIPMDNPLIGRTGPTAVLSAQPMNPGSRRPRHEIKYVDWRHKGFGQPDIRFKSDDVLFGNTLEETHPNKTQDARIFSTLVAENGSWVTDGSGTAIASEKILTDPQRNLGWSKRAVERELARLCGIDKVIWLPQGLSRNTRYQTWGGHVDQLVNFVEPGRLVLHWQDDQNHPDYAVSRASEEILAEATDVSENRLSVIRVPAPQTQTDAHGPVNWSYLDFRIINESLFLPRFIDPNDQEALEIFSQLFPERTITQVFTQELNDRGLNMRSVTLPFPKTRL